MPKSKTETGSTITVWIDPSMKRRFRVVCAEQDASMSGVLSELIARYVREKEKERT